MGESQSEKVEEIKGEQEKPKLKSNSQSPEEFFLTFDKPFGMEGHIFNMLLYGTTHSLALYYLILNFLGIVPNTFVPEFIYGYLGGLGITVGCHRYWTHRAFKAKLPLQIFLMILQTISLQLPIRKWCLDHRIHHKYTDTDSDPHNSEKGFWYSHVGWKFLPKHPEFRRRLQSFDVSDLDNDPVVRFQNRWFWPLQFFFQVLVPVYVLQSFWPEMTVLQCIGANMRRYVVSLHITFCVNSVAHMWGDKPYDRTVTSVENFWVSLLAIGEGWHNFHHTFPWDYKTSEFGWKLNISTVFIDFCAWLGLAYDRKTASNHVVEARMKRTGQKADSVPKESNIVAVAPTPDPVLISPQIPPVPVKDIEGVRNRSKIPLPFPLSPVASSTCSKPCCNDPASWSMRLKQSLIRKRAITTTCYRE
ncbi:unnamed protein product [Orchesella dallaii]|uniref:Fatty acid desaturase domain-containing protein n=1 Tax=Orchesella dallaii TaxID=48710 RepID=A0ABP1RLK4_9HEXA